MYIYIYIYIYHKYVHICICIYTYTCIDDTIYIHIYVCIHGRVNSIQHIVPRGLWNLVTVTEVGTSVIVF